MKPGHGSPGSGIRSMSNEGTPSRSAERLIGTAGGAAADTCVS